MAVTSNVYVHSNPPKAISGHGAAIRSWVKNGDLDKLENVVLEGQGARLLGLMESTGDLRVKAFLKSVPSYMAKVDLIHDAVNKGNLRETQSLIDKRKLVTARDAVGRSIAHKAVLSNQRTLLEWLCKKYPEVVHLRDNEGRTPLHYTAALKEPSDLFGMLVGLGASQEVVDIHGRKPGYYVDHPMELDIEGGRSYSRNKARRSPMGTTSTSSSTPTGSTQPTRAQIRIWIHERDINKLEKIVWSGNGDKLLLETTNNSRIRRFLDNVPHLLSKIKQIHSAAIQNDVSALKKLKPISLPELFVSKDQRGLTPLHKAVALNNRSAVEWLLYESGGVNEVDNEGKSPLHYANPNMFSFLIKNGADDTILDNKGRNSSYYRQNGAEVDLRFVRSVPDAPRVVGEMPGWERGSSPGGYKRKMSSGEFENDDVKVRRVNSLDSGTGLGEESGNTALEIEDVGDGYVGELVENHLSERKLEEQVIEGEEEELDRELMELRDEEPEVERAVTPQMELMEQQEPNWETEYPAMVYDDVQPPQSAQIQAVQEEERRSTAAIRKSPVRGATSHGINSSLARSTTSHGISPEVLNPHGISPEMHPHHQEEELHGAATEQTVDGYIEGGSMEHLVDLVLNGHGHLLLNKSSSNPEVEEFLQNVPAYMAKIASIHSAAGAGNLKDLQNLLDRKRLAQARDEGGRVALHMAVLGGHVSVVRYLVGNYPQAINSADLNGRTPLHYSATLPDQGTIYKVLIQSGADPNLKDMENNTPGIYLRRKDLLPHSALLSGTVHTPVASGMTSKLTSGGKKHHQSEVDSWERPPTPQRALTGQHQPEQQGKFSPILIKETNITSKPPEASLSLDLDPIDPEHPHLHLLVQFYREISAEDTVWKRTWRRLTSKKGTTDIVRAYLDRYLTQELFDLLKLRATPRYGATLLDCIRFYPQFFIVAADPHCYATFRELFLPAIEQHSGSAGGLVHKELVFGGNIKLIDQVPIVDLPSKFVSQVRIRVSRNIRPYPFVSMLKREDLDQIREILWRQLGEKVIGWDVVELDGLEKEEREEIVGRGVLMPEATKISRFWPKSRSILTSEDKTIWIHGEDHLDLIVCGRYGRLGPMMRQMEELYSLVGGVDFHFNSQMGYLTVDPFRCGTGVKITFRLRLPHLMKSRSDLTANCDRLNLFIKWNKLNSEEIDSDDFVELENIATFGLDENEIALRTAEGVNELIKMEEKLGRDEDLRQTGGKKT